MVDLSELLARSERGDDDAGSELLNRLRPFVLGRLRHAAKTRNWFWLDDLDDVAQEVLVRFFEAVRDQRFAFRDEMQLRGFLVRTAFFVAMKRKDATALERPEADFLNDEEREKAIEAFDLSRFADAAFDTLGRKQCVEELYRAVEGLQAPRAEVLRLTLLGLKPREIAPRMGRSSNAVSVLKFHALEDLKAALEQTDFAQNCGKYFL